MTDTFSGLTPPEYYADDLTPDDALVTLEQADAILEKSLHGRQWSARVRDDRRACFDNPERNPQRDQDKAALCDASTIMVGQPWKGRVSDVDQIQPFPRAGLVLADGKVVYDIPRAVRTATALLAVHLIAKADQPMSADVFRSYQTGEVRGEFRAPMRDDLPRHVRTLIAPFINGGTTWSPVRP